MSKCCGVSPCNCRVTAGTGTTVTGNGSAANPYVISATGGGGTTALAVTDSETVDFDLTGSGTADDPYEITGSVILDPSPPRGGTNLLQEGPDGLFVECADVRTCISATDGATYDPATGEIGAKVSTDAGNQVSIGTDGGLYAPPASSSAPTVVQAGDTQTANTTVAGTGTAADPYIVSTDVILDPAPPQGGSNLLQDGPDGLFVECADVRTCFSAVDGATYDPATGEIGVKVSTDAGNQTSIGTDGGIYTPAPASTATVLQSQDTSTVDTTITGSGSAADPYVVEADVIVAPEQNGLEATGDGLLVAPSSDTGNQLGFGADGRLFVAPDPPLEVGCGLQGDGTTATPLAARPARGLDAWADHWSCDAAQNSTLRCDPNTGFLWTPPEHYSIDDHFYIDHMASTVTQGVTSGWVSLSPGGTVANVAWSIPANAFGNMCRAWGYNVHCHASVDISANSTATFEIGYILQINGTTVGARPIEGVYTAFGAARRERYAGSVSDASFRIPASTAWQIVAFPAVHVIAGSITINSWISDATLSTQTRD
ncbi:hypothetical protein [Streptomyces carpinensis]|uniref:Uncharacterized protein n=1 Tax=Streptomyces carpinensis TaxID=66369 RepID=A0ABV1VUV8_9ACTN|nr:hypothetical protein [Streptomyces carpinensis]